MAEPKPRALFQLWPRLEAELGFLPLGDYPTPIEPLALEGSDPRDGEVYVKRDDVSSPLYGGNRSAPSRHCSAWRGDRANAP